MSLIIYHSPIGNIEIVGEAGFVNKIHFLNEDEKVEEFIHPNDESLLLQCKAELDEYFNGEKKSFTFPIQQVGTDFQQRVWNKLMNISYGKTITYLDLAKQLGDAKCIRAAGTANGKNHIAIAVPCHRVIGSNQKLVGYAGGLWRKQWLLEHEAKFGNGALRLF